MLNRCSGWLPLWRRGCVQARHFAVKSVRVRQHVNPLSQRYQEPIDLPTWMSVFPTESRRLHLDIGCARAQYLLQLAARDPTRCFLGVEIREPLVHEAVARVQEQQLQNAHIIHANMNVHLGAIMQSLAPEYTVESVSIFHPDPWMKKRHVKRRLVNAEFVDALAMHLPTDTPVYLQTDVLDLFEYMLEIFHACPRYVDEGPSAENAMGIPTDRERYVVDEGGDIYRTTLRTK
ncbi:hypothetical protein AC1031_015989 [Aphanomyces cochlioides]|nr:hypothetical protein AC1031_015989 [Aphanomyces cochlioides]